MGIVNFFVIVFFILLGIGPNGHNISVGEKKALLRKKSTFQEAHLKLEDPIERIVGDASLRVIGGYKAAPHEFPYAVILHIRRKSSLGVCGGTLITTRYVLTAAHCIINAISVKIFLGGQYVKGDYVKDPSVITMESHELIPHKKYGGKNSGKNDIGLVRLPERVTLNENISTVELAEGRDLFIGSVGIFLGWGRTSQKDFSNGLQFTNLKILTNEECASYYGDVIQDYHLCALGDGTEGGCYGDSGGPLIVDCVQVGVTAVVAEGCETGKPTVFTRLTEFNHWITYHTKRRRRRSQGDKITTTLKVYIVVMFCLVFIS